MKRNAKGYLEWALPAALMVVVAAVSEITKHYTFIQKENLSLFLSTPDWMKEMRNDGAGLFGIARSFVTQFMDLPLFGAVLCGLEAVLAYFLVKVLAWMLRLKHRTTVEAAAACLIAVCFEACDLGPERVRDTERWSKVEVCARNHDWGKVLEAATPEAAMEDRELIPFAALALGGNGELSSKLFTYPVEGPQDLDRDGEVSRRGYFFTSLLYECLGSPNEAIHNLFQSACFLPHGTSSMVLRQLVKLNIENGNYTLARKYLKILEHSPRNRALARKALKLYEGKADTIADSTRTGGATAPVITNAPVYNLAQIQALGNKSQFSVDRLLCSLLLERDLDNFRKLYSRIDWEGQQVPRHYAEALLLCGSDPQSLNIPDALTREYAEFVEAMKSGNLTKARSLSTDSYWGYYYRDNLSGRQ